MSKSLTFPAMPSPVFHQKVIHTLRVDSSSHSLFKFPHLSSETVYEKAILTPEGPAVDLRMHSSAVNS